MLSSRLSRGTLSDSRDRLVPQAQRPCCLPLLTVLGSVCEATDKKLGVLPDRWPAVLQKPTTCGVWEWSGETSEVMGTVPFLYHFCFPILIGFWILYNTFYIRSSQPVGCDPFVE